jgi:hypothetical protein
MCRKTVAFVWNSKVQTKLRLLTKSATLTPRILNGTLGRKVCNECALGAVGTHLPQYLARIPIVKYDLLLPVSRHSQIELEYRLTGMSLQVAPETGCAAWKIVGNKLFRRYYLQQIVACDSVNSIFLQPPDQMTCTNTVPILYGRMHQCELCVATIWSDIDLSRFNAWIRIGISQETCHPVQ